MNFLADEGVDARDLINFTSTAVPTPSHQADGRFLINNET